MNLPTYLFLSCLLLRPSLSASDAAKQQEAINRLEQAVDKTNIFALPSFVLKASVQLDNRGKLAEGIYQLLWNGPDQWKEEIVLPGYTEVQVGGKGVVWVKRATDFLPLPVYDLHRALGYGSSLGSPPAVSLVRWDIKPSDRVKKNYERKEHGEKLACVEIESEQKRSSEFCTREGSETLARISSSYGDNDLQPVGEKVFPRLLSFVRDGKAVAKVTVTELTTPGRFAPNAFTPPAGVSPQAGCMNPVSPTILTKKPPQYPESARMQRVQGTVAVHISIGKDGVPAIRRVVDTPGSDLTASSLAALKEWRYEPPTCDGQSVQVETIVEVNYTLSYH